MNLTSTVQAFRSVASSMAGAIWPEPKRSRSIRWSSSLLRACTRRRSSTASSVRSAMLRQTIGVVSSSSARSARGRSGEMDYLLQSADDRAGALGFGLNEKPPAPMRQFNKTLELWRSFKPSRSRSSRTRIRCAGRRPSRCKSCCSAGHRWVARVPRLSSRIAKVCGSPSSIGPTTAGIVRASSMPCSASPRMRDLGRREQGASPSLGATCCW